MIEFNLFESVDHLAPKCKSCDVVLDYGSNTKFNEESQNHVCLQCGNEIS